MRIVSLLPAATDWICAFGGAGDLIGRSHACDAPEAAALPALTHPASGIGEGDSASIDAAVHHRLAEGLSLFDVNVEALRALAPDLIVTQAQCDVCAVSLGDLEAALAEGGGTGPEILSLQPMTFKQTLDAALRLGRKIGRLPEAMRVLAEGEQRLAALHRALARRRDGSVAGAPPPTVVCIEWVEPLMTAGHWMPDVVNLAGGRAVGAEAGTPSQYVDFSDLVALDPDVIAVTACGLGVEAALGDLAYLTERPGWIDLKAVQNGCVFVFDGSVYFNRPGPGLVRSVELLAAALHGAPGVAPELWEMARVAPPRSATSPL